MQRVRELEKIRASEFYSFPSMVRDELRRLKGGIVINDCFWDDFGTRDKIKLYFGSYGSGKSIFIVQDLIEKCRHDKYFKCYYGRKVFDTVRGSCFETIYETIEELGLEDEFHYSKANTSSMVIVHKETGNKFVPFGSDKPDKLKSIKDPTHIWCEEFDQFEDADELTGRKGDFQLLFPRLRTTKAETQFIASFNTDPVYSTHWIMKYFFPELYSGDDKAEFELLDGISITKTFANYVDNYFIDQEAYYQSLKLASGGSVTTLQAIAEGAWGVLQNKDPWIYSFNRNKHVKNVNFMPSFPIYVFMDVNNDPLEASIWQISPNKGERNSFIHCIDEMSGKIKATELGQRVKAKYPNSIIFLGGDRSGQNEDVGRNQTIYQIIGGEMGLSQKQYLLNTHNLEHSDSRILCNAMIHNYPNFYINGEKCPNLIRQIQTAKVDIKSSTPSKLLKDRGMFKNDMLDSMRYMFQTLFNDFAKNTYFKAIKK